MKAKKDSLITLPEKEFYGIEEVATVLSSLTGKTIRTKYILDYIKQGVLPAYIYHDNTYSLVGKSQLRVFARHLGGNVAPHISFSDPLEPQASNLYGWVFDPSEDKVYVKHENLMEFKKGHTDKGSEMSPIEDDKPLTTKELKSISIIIMSLAELGGVDTEKTSKAATVIQSKAEKLGLNISTNTIRKYLEEARKVLHPE